MQSPPYTLIFTGTGLVKGTTINFTWVGGGGTGTVKYYSGTTLVVTVPPTVPSTVTQITATACNQVTFCSAPLNIGYAALSSSGGTLTAAPNPATVQQQVALTSTFSAGPNPTPGAGAPSGTVTFANGATTLGTAKLLLDKATASLQNVRTTVVSAPPARTLYTADFNADGIPDVLFVDNGTPQLLHVDLGNTPFGSFQPDLTYKLPGTCTSASSLATGDLNGDGLADVVVDCQDGGGNVFVYALLSNGDGTFAPAIAVNGALGTQVALKDMNKDGKLDLVVAGRTQGAVSYTHLDVYKRQVQQRGGVAGAGLDVVGVVVNGLFEGGERILIFIQRVVHAAQVERRLRVLGIERERGVELVGGALVVGRAAVGVVLDALVEVLDRCVVVNARDEDAHADSSVLAGVDLLLAGACLLYTSRCV